MARRTEGWLVRVALLAALVAVAPAAGLAEVATPAPASAGITLVASGLTNPRGFTWGPDGTLYVAQAGSGGNQRSSGQSAQERANGLYFGGLTGSVAEIAGGCPVTFAGDLPSSRAENGHVQGASAVAILDGRLYVLEDGGGVVHGNPATPNGVYVVNGDGSARLVADLSAWTRANPVAQVPGDADPDGEWFAMVAGPDALWLIESNNGQLVRVTPDGAIKRVADLSKGHPVPTAIALAPDGGSVYVGFLTPAPYVDGSSQVIEVAPGGTLRTVWSGLTMVTALAVGPDGALYALEMATGNTGPAPFIHPGTGRVVRQTGPNTAAVVATGFDYPIAMGFGPAGGLHVGFPAFGPAGASGAIVRLDVQQGQVMRMSPAVLAGSPCPGAAPTAAPAAPTPSSAPTTPTGAPHAATPAGTGNSTAPAGAQKVTIKNFSFNPPTLTVAAGTTVTWTNNDTASHTVTADAGAFDSGNLSPGQSFSFTFKKPGTYSYHCNYHPNMHGTIIVK